MRTAAARNVARRPPPDNQIGGGVQIVSTTRDSPAALHNASVLRRHGGPRRPPERNGSTPRPHLTSRRLADETTSARRPRARRSASAASPSRLSAETADHDADEEHLRAPRQQIERRCRAARRPRTASACGGRHRPRLRGRLEDVEQLAAQFPSSPEVIHLRRRNGALAERLVE